MTDELLRALRLHSAVQSGLQGQARHAIVTAVDPGQHAVKLTIQPEGLVSGWLPDPGIACAGLQIACPSEVGTQVLVVPVEGDSEHPVIVARLFDTANPAPISSATGQAVQAGEIGFFLKNGPYLHLTPSAIYVKGKLVLDGSIEASGDVVAMNISVVQHVHGGVQTGSGQTSTPVASS